MLSTPLQYIVDGFLWYTAPPRYSGSSWGFEGGVRLQRIAASGAVYWQETCSPAAGVRVLAYDQDASDGPASGADDFMGGSTTGVLGTFSISLNPLKAGRRGLRGLPALCGPGPGCLHMLSLHKWGATRAWHTASKTGEPAGV